MPAKPARSSRFLVWDESHACFMCLFSQESKHERISGWWLQTTKRIRLKLQVYYSDYHPVSSLVRMTGKPHNVKGTCQECQRWHYHKLYLGSILNIWMGKTLKQTTQRHATVFLRENRRDTEASQYILLETSVLTQIRSPLKRLM